MPTTACFTSDTDSIAFLTVSRLSFVKYNRLKSISNFSSSISCTLGTALITSPSSSNALNTKNALAAFKIQDSCKDTVIPKIFWLSFCAFSNVCFSKSEIDIDWYFASPSPSPESAEVSSFPPSGAFAACSGASFPVAFAAIAFKVFTISSFSSVPSFAVSIISLRYASNASSARNNTSINSDSTFIFSLRISWKTFSISCVRRCIRLKPIVPAIPFNECAARKISLMTSMFSGSCSRTINWSLKFCKCSFVSSIKISRY